MSEVKAEHALATWTVPECQVAIEYSLETLEEVRAYVQDGLKQLSRGGLEVGGVLFGARGDNLVRILTWRPVQCEHARGPAFLLSQNDRMALGQLLQNAKSDPSLTDLHALGWFVSHTRVGIQLTDADLKIYDHYFPWSWQIALVLQPFRTGRANAGFFFRDAEGSVKADASYREFAIEPPVSQGQSKAAARAEAAARLPATARSFQPPPPPKKDLVDRRLWIWAVPLLLALIVGALLLQKPGSRGTPAGFGFHVVDVGGELRLEWDKTAEPVREAVRGTLDIKDGSSDLQIPVAGDRLRDGTFTYSRKTGDLEVRMTVYPVNSAPVQESARFVGPPVDAPKSDEAAAARRERESLITEVNRMRDALRKETVRNRELEEGIRILKERLQIQQTRKPSRTRQE